MSNNVRKWDKEEEFLKYTITILQTYSIFLYCENLTLSWNGQTIYYE